MRYFAIECRTVPLLWEQRKQENMLSAHVVRFRGQDRCSFPPPPSFMEAPHAIPSSVWRLCHTTTDPPEDKLQARERATLSPPPTKTLHDLSQGQRLLRSLPPSSWLSGPGDVHHQRYQYEIPFRKCIMHLTYRMYS